MHKNFSLLPLVLVTTLAVAASPAEDFAKADVLAAAGRKAEALAVLEQLNRGTGAPVRAATLQIYLLTDLNQFPAALNASERASRQLPNEPAVWLARGYLHRRNNQPGLALLSYQKVLALEPGNKDAMQGQVYAYRDMGGSALAWQELQRKPDLVDAATYSGVRHAYAVELLKLHSSEAESPQSQYALLDESLLLMRQNKTPDNKQMADFLVALAERHLDKEVVTTYAASLATPGVASWAELSVAGSYTHLGKYREAAALLESAHKTRPDELRITYALVYGYTDLQRFGDAQKLIDSVIQKLTVDNSADLPFARQLQAQVYSWSGDVSAAGKLLAGAIADHPKNVGLQRAQAAWLADSWRIRASREKLDELRTRDPENVEAQLAFLELEGPSYPQKARQAFGELLVKHPYDERIIKAKREFDRAQKSYLYAGTTFGGDRDSTGRVTTLEISSNAFGPYASRFYLESRLARDSLKDGVREQRQAAVGLVQPIGPAWTAQAAVVHNSATSGTGLKLKVSGELGESTRMTVRASTLDAEVPARAVNEGVTSRSAGIELSHQMTSGMKLSGSLAHQSLSDGNQRESASVAATGVLPAVGNFRLEWAGRAGIDTSSKSNVSYFSPRTAVWTEVEGAARMSSLNIGGTQYISTRPFISVGTFSQTGFATKGTIAAGFGSTWPLTKQVSLNFDVRVVRRPYDGVYTTQHFGQLSLFARLP